MKWLYFLPHIWYTEIRNTVSGGVEMRRYYRIILTALVAVMLSACAGKSDEPATERAKEPTEAVVPTQPESRAPDIQIAEETSAAAEAETGVQESTQAATEAAGQSTAETQAAKTQPSRETEPAKVYSVEAFETTMYATASVNVRASYTTQSEVLTSLTPGQKVQVTGRSANGWMRIIYDGRDAFVYQKYLSDGAPTTEPATTRPDREAESQTQPPAPDVSLYPGDVTEDPVKSPGELPIVAPAPIMTAPEQDRSVMENGPGMITPGGGESWTEPVLPGSGPGM